MKYILIFLSFIVLTSCTANKKTVKNTSTKEYSSSESSTITSSTEVKEVVTDPITMERCDKDKSIEYEGQYFCTMESLNKYKEQTGN